MKKLLPLILFFGLTVNAQAELAVIVHPQSNIESISDRQLANIFLSKTTKLPGGGKAHPVELNSTRSKTRFYGAVSGKKEVELRKYWATIIFTGKGQPPKQLRTVESLIEYVNNRPGAIAYVPKESLNTSVKVLRYIK